MGVHSEVENSPGDCFPEETRFETSRLRMLKWFEFLKNFPFGIFVGFIAAMTLFWIFGADISDDLTRYGTYVLTAMASLLASAVAFATAVWNAERQRELRLRAARASLPLALSEMVSASRNGYQYAKNTTGWDDIETNFPQLQNDINLSDKTIETIQAVIASSDTVTADWLAVFLAHYQVNVARLTGRSTDFKNIGFEDDCIDECADWIIQTAIVNHLFNYARTGSEPETKFSLPLLPLADRHSDEAEHINERIEMWHRITNGFELSKIKKI